MGHSHHLVFIKYIYWPHQKLYVHDMYIIQIKRMHLLQNEISWKEKSFFISLVKSFILKPFVSANITL